MPPRKTHLEHWLQVQHKPRTAFARELGLNRDVVVLLATPEAHKRKFQMVRFDALRLISAATGIDIGTLVKDAMGIEETGDGEAKAAE